MKKIMIIGAGDFQLPLVQKAAEKYQVILVAPVIGEAFLPYIDKKYLLDVRKKEEILAIARQEQIDVAFLDPDLPELNGLYLGQYLQDLNPLVNLIYLAESEK